MFICNLLGGTPLGIQVTQGGLSKVMPNSGDMSENEPSHIDGSCKMTVTSISQRLIVVSYEHTRRKNP